MAVKFRITPKELDRLVRRLMLKARVSSLLHWNTAVIEIDLPEGSRMLVNGETTLVGPGPVTLIGYTHGRRIVR